MLEVIQIPSLNDNYIYLAHCNETGDTAVIDPAVADLPLKIASKNGWKINYILNTHHHYDHIGGNLEIKQQTGCKIVGYGDDAARINGIDIKLNANDKFKLGNSTADILPLFGHTIGHIAYSFKDDNILFSGDVVFPLGCGRVFEGTMAQMWHSIKILRALPDQTKIYCAHEYSQENARFAITIEPDNIDLIKRIVEIDALRQKSLPTVPSIIAEEIATNPFFRADNINLAKNLGFNNSKVNDDDALTIFSEIRQRKNKF